MMGINIHEPPSPSGLSTRFDETLMQTVLHRGPTACVWQAPQGLVVPRSYLRSAHFDGVCQDFASRGWPVSVRHSGGGVVPQGPGVLNLSLAYAVDGRPLDHSDTAYARLCAIVTQAVGQFGVQAHTQAVEGSFCDGRFNLAVGHGDRARKIAGTAQLWRRHMRPSGSGYAQIVLVHALILVATDVQVVTEQANALEEALGNDRRYLPERAVSLHTLCPEPVEDATAFVKAMSHELHEALRAVDLVVPQDS